MRRPRRPQAPAWPAWLSVLDAQALLLHLQVVPTTRHTRVMGADGHRLCLQVAAEATPGAVDRAVVRFVAEAVGLEVPQVALVAGARRPRKTLRLSGVSPRRCLLRLAPGQ